MGPLAQFSLIATTEWLDRLPLFGGTLVRNFLDAGQMSDRFFSLLIFLHIGIPLALLAGMWLHIQRVVRADVTPSRALALGTLATLAVLAFVDPALSQAPADVATAPSRLPLDWWLLFVHPVMYRTSPAALWVAVAGFAALTLALPWLVRAPRPAVARVSPRELQRLRALLRRLPVRRGRDRAADRREARARPGARDPGALRRLRDLRRGVPVVDAVPLDCGARDRHRHAAAAPGGAARRARSARSRA